MSFMGRFLAVVHWEHQSFEDCFGISMTECQSWSSLTASWALLRTSLKYSWHFYLFGLEREHLAIISQLLFAKIFPVSCSMYFVRYWTSLLPRCYESWSEMEDLRSDHCPEFQRKSWWLACSGNSTILSLVCSWITGSWYLAAQIGWSHSSCANSTAYSLFYLWIFVLIICFIWYDGSFPAEFFHFQEIAYSLGRSAYFWYSVFLRFQNGSLSNSFGKFWIWFMTLASIIHRPSLKMKAQDFRGPHGSCCCRPELLGLTPLEATDCCSGLCCCRIG